MTGAFAPEPTPDRGTGTEGVQRFRKRPVTVEAVRWTGENLAAIREWLGADASGRVAGPVTGPGLGNKLVVHTLEGNMRALTGDWIIRGVRGEAYPCRDDIFAETYEPVTEDSSDE